MGVVEALTADLEAMGRRARDSTLAATALALAGALDDAHNSATSKSMCAKSLVDVLRELRALAPLIPEADNVTNLNSRRDERRVGVAASPDPVGS